MTQHSVITQHRMDLFHEFDWDNVHILDKEQILYKRISVIRDDTY